MSSTMRVLGDTTELVELHKASGLYLKPVSVFNVSVALPQLKDPSQSISNWDLMERLKKAVHPLQFAAIKVSKSTMEFVRFEAEAQSREQMKRLIAALDNSALKVIGFYESLKVKAGEAKVDFPTRHDWDSFFRDAENMNELRAGERPDTIYLAQLPLKWFLVAEAPDPEAATPNYASLPSEALLRRVFETFGEVRAVDIPICDPFRKQMSKTGMRSSGFNYGSEMCFEAYVQFVEYISFVKAMDALRGMKLVRVGEGRAWAASLKVDFDRTKHLSDKSNRRRRQEREKLAEEERRRRQKEEEAKQRLEEQRAKMDDAAFQRRRQREEKRRVKALEKKRLREQLLITQKIAEEERRLLVAERKLVSIRLLTVLFRRIEQARKSDAVKTLEADLEALITAEREEKSRRKEEASARQRLLQRHNLRLKTETAAPAVPASAAAPPKAKSPSPDVGEILSEHSDGAKSDTSDDDDIRSRRGRDERRERSPLRPKTPEPPGPARSSASWARDRSPPPARGFSGRNWSTNWSREPSQSFGRDFSREPSQSFSRGFSREPSQALSRGFSREPSKAFSREPSRRPDSRRGMSVESDLDSTFDGPTIRSKVVQRSGRISLKRSAAAEDRGLGRQNFARLLANDAPERCVREGEDEERFPAVAFKASEMPPRYGGAIPKPAYQAPRQATDAPRRVQPPQSPPVDHGGGDPFEMQLEGGL